MGGKCNNIVFSTKKEQSGMTGIIYLLNIYLILINNTTKTKIKILSMLARRLPAQARHENPKTQKLLLTIYDVIIYYNSRCI